MSDTGFLRDDSDEAHYRQVEVDLGRLTMLPDDGMIATDPGAPEGMVVPFQEGRTFSTGATRDTDEGKFDYEAFNAPIVERAYASYMHDNREQVDGVIRDGDNWQNGMPRRQYMKSLIRHVFDLWYRWRQAPLATGPIITLLCAIRFNVNGLLFEILTGRDVPDA